VTPFSRKLPANRVCGSLEQAERVQLAATAVELGLADVAAAKFHLVQAQEAIGAEFCESIDRALDLLEAGKLAADRPNLVIGLEQLGREFSRKLGDLAARRAVSVERVLAPKYLMVGSFPACCARAASGHEAAAPPSSVMKSRRFNWSNCIRSPASQGRIAGYRNSSSPSPGEDADFARPRGHR
jgi:hypothetical protein